MNAVRLCETQQPSVLTVQQMFNIFRVCQYFGQYTDFIAMAVADVYAIHENVGYITGFSSAEGIHVVMV